MTTEMISTGPAAVSFTDRNKMSPNLIELRIDHHLNRIMKNYRLVNFCNAIQTLPVHARICEKILEILTSCEGLIERKMNQIKDAKDFLVQLRQISKGMQEEDDDVSKDKLMQLWPVLKEVAMNTEQIVWALNSNKEHLRYLARIYVIPVVYKRTDEEKVQLKQMYNRSIEDCEEVIEICKLIRSGICSQLKSIYSLVHLIDPNPKSLLERPQQQQQQA